MEWLTNPEIWIGLITLTVLEIVLGIDNVVFISILAEKLPEHQPARARQTDLSLALVTRIRLLFFFLPVIGVLMMLFRLTGVGVH
jgi:predicted tellurium resistance membrane protein TerC